MINVIAFPSRSASPAEAHVLALSQTRSRNAALERLVPHLLGLLWDGGRSCPHLPKTWRVIVGDHEVGGYLIHDLRIGLNVYTGVGCSSPFKAFSVHLGASVALAREATYLNGQCTVLNWKRGIWEDELIAEPTEGRTLAHVFTAGRLTRNR